MGLSSTDPGVGGWGRVDTRGRGDRRGRVVSREAGYYRRRVARGTRGSDDRGRTSHTLHFATALHTTSQRYSGNSSALSHRCCLRWRARRRWRPPERTGGGGGGGGTGCDGTGRGAAANVADARASQVGPVAAAAALVRRPDSSRAHASTARMRAMTRAAMARRSRTG